jgi:hypothetical protein
VPLLHLLPGPAFAGQAAPLPNLVFITQSSTPGLDHLVFII